MSGSSKEPIGPIGGATAEWLDGQTDYIERALTTGEISLPTPPQPGIGLAGLVTELSAATATLARVLNDHMAWHEHNRARAENLVETPPRDTMLVVRDGEEAKLPVRAHATDAGFDLYTSETTRVPAGAYVDVPCGVRLGLPPGTWGLVIGRSSSLRRRGLHVVTNVIDSGYIGPMYALCWHDGSHGQELTVVVGERVAQLVLLPNLAASTDVVEVQFIKGTDRGDRGFGSTGR